VGRALGLGGAVGALLGCAGVGATAPTPPAGADLLALRTAQGTCHLERVSLPGGAARELGQVPGACSDWELVLSRDGARVLLPRAGYEVDLAARQARPLPALDALHRPTQIEETLDYDAQGAPTWHVRWGEGEPTWVDRPVYPEVHDKRYVLRDGAWVEQAAVEVSGRRLHPMDATEGEPVTDPALRRALDQAAGKAPEGWQTRGPLAWEVRDEGEAGLVSSEPLLLELKPLEGLGSHSLALEVRGDWLRMAHPGSGARVVDLTTGELAWSGKEAAVFWPADLP
jgi:hypothetical protein